MRTYKTRTHGEVQIDDMLVMSTAHLSTTTAATLNALPLTDQLDLDWGPEMVYREGWVWWTRDENECGEYPTEFAAIFALARAIGCRWVRFDCDADRVDNLPTWEW